MTLEIACFNIESCVIAQSAGAGRVEFCADYESGGVTPPGDEIRKARELMAIPLHVMIRPRAGDFVYGEKEIAEMKKSILFCRQNKVNGIVFGALNKNNTIDENLCEEVKDLSQDMKVTFHRAIDEAPDLAEQVEILAGLGIERVLTAGGKKGIEERLRMLETLNKKLRSQIVILPCGGIRAHNIKSFAETGCFEFHSAAITGREILADKNEIAQMKNILNSFLK